VNGGQRPMRRDQSTGIKKNIWIAVHLVPAILAICPAVARSDEVELVLDRSPSEGGLVTPGAGVHRFAPRADVTITALPQPGYRFAYWLGDVVDPTSSTTCIRMGISKAVVAVFEADQAETSTEPRQDVIVESHGGGGGGGGGGLVHTAANFWVGGSISVSGGTPSSGQTIVRESPSAPVPEPATLALMGLGAAILCRTNGPRSGEAVARRT